MPLYSDDFETKPYRIVYSKTPEFHNSLVPQAGDWAQLHVKHKMEVHLSTSFHITVHVFMAFFVPVQHH